MFPADVGLTLGVIAWVGGIVLACLFITIKVGPWWWRQCSIMFGSESPEQQKAAIAAVQQEAMEVMGRELTLPELQQWWHNRQMGAMVKVGVVGGIIALHSWHDGR